VIYGNSGGNDATFSEIARTDELILEYTRTGLSPPGETFKFKVSAENGVGEGS